jgi:hypothetical protein
MTRVVILVVVALLVIVTDTVAIDHTNLDEGRPLRLEDAYPIAHGEIAVEAGSGVTLPRRGPNRGVFGVELLYGALPNLHISIGSLLSTDARAIDEPPRSGDLHLSALYNFNQETISVPAFAAKLGLNTPTGVDARGFGVDLKGIVTKSIERLGVHLNAGREFLTAPRDGERDGRYELALGASYPIGAPQFTRATLMGDVFSEQSVHRGEATTVGTEIGIRYQLTTRVVWDVGMGTEFAGPPARSRFFMTTGFSFGF